MELEQYVVLVSGALAVAFVGEVIKACIWGVVIALIVRRMTDR